MPSSQSVVPASEQASVSEITPRLLTVKQASAYTGATIWHIRELYWAKEVAGFIAGRRLLIERHSLDAYISRKLAERAQ